MVWGWLTEEEAVEQLSGKPPRAFLVRMSGSSCRLTVSYVGADRAIKYTIVPVKDMQFIAKDQTFEFTEEVLKRLAHKGHIEFTYVCIDELL